MPAETAFIIALPLLVFCAGCQTKPQMSFRNDVYPILQENCVDCHIAPDGKGYRKSGLSLANYSSLMAGTIYGPVIVPGDSNRSILNMLVEGRSDATLRMPHDEKQALSADEIRILNLWVKQGAHDN